MHNTTMTSIAAFILSLLLCFSAAVIGSIFTISAIPSWYQSLNKPPFNPPNWIFAPVWSLLYFLMAVSLWLVWTKIGWNWEHPAYYIFLAQLVLNALWSVLFFGYHHPDWAFMEIIPLWFLITASIFSFWNISPLAGVLLIPYLGWVSFATLLNYSIWKLN